VFEKISEKPELKEMVSKLVCALSAILFSHRYDKKDQFAMDFESAGRKINFDIIRDVMYKYSKKS
jgi:hypothetical protein